MQKYFIEVEDFKQGRIVNDDAFHIKKVMRNKENDNVLVGVDNKTYLVSLYDITEKCVSFKVIEDVTKETELPIKVTIIQGYPKGDKFEDIIKHGTELGAYEFIPCLLKRSMFKVDEKRKDNKIIRFNKIAKEAAEQSYRNYLPKVTRFMTLKEIDFSIYDKIIVCYEEASKNGELTKFKTTIKSLNENDKICIIVGPEGGIDAEEIAYLEEKGAVIASLGKRILRTETVVFAALSAISYEMELKNV